MQHASVGLQAPRDAKPPINRTLGDFRLLRELGRGGMGIVYEAEQLSLGRPVALKVLPYAALLDNRQLERFKNEARAAAMLKHPHIVSVHAVGSERSVHYYAMELIRGRSLEEVIAALRRGEDETTETSAEERRGEDDSVLPRALNRRSEEAVPGEGSPGADTAAVAELSTLRSGDRKGYYRSVAELGLQAAEALEYAHGEGVIHRDVKPSNLMLDEGGRLHVTDFGLARVQNVEALTMTGDVLGTLRYMSPEQAEGRYVDHRSDVYSLGVTLYELATLRPALDGKDRRELLRRLAESQPKPPREVDPRIPRDLETVILKATAPAVEERYETAQEFADDLQRFLASEPVLAQRPGPWRHFVRWVGRNRVVASLFACSLILLTALAIGGPILAVRLATFAAGETEARKEAEAAQQRAEEATSDLQRLLTNTLAETIVTLENTPGVDQLLERLIEESATQFNDLMESTHISPTQRRDLANAYTQLGRVVEFRFNKERSIQMVQRSLRELERTAESLPNDSELQFALGDAMGFLSTKRDDIELGRRSVAVLEPLVASSPLNFDYRLRLLWARTFVTDVQTRHHDFEAARSELLALREAWQSLCDNYPDEVDPRGGLAYTKWKLGDRYRFAGYLTIAEQELREALEIPLDGIGMDARFRVAKSHLRHPLAFFF
ncbi:MAG: serine/threonine protein kinase, partial [Planctomycetales bacterium]|nr:serine/threonine protein kinase [Planctomycetales bacterium]